MAFTKLYLTTNTAPFTPTNMRGAWDDSASVVTKALEPKTIGGGTIVQGAQVLETSTDPAWDVLLYRGVSGPVSAQTISGNLDIVIFSHMTAGAALKWHVHAYVTAGDSDTVRGTLINDYIDSANWTSDHVARALASAQAMSSVGASEGDRIVVEIGYQAQNVTASAHGGLLWYGTQRQIDNAPADDATAGSTDETNLAGFISFSNSITEPIITTRVTQFAAEWPNSGESEAKVTQFAGEWANSGTREARVTQFVVEFVTKQDDQFINVFVAGF